MKTGRRKTGEENRISGGSPGSGAAEKGNGRSVTRTIGYLLICSGIPVLLWFKFVVVRLAYTRHAPEEPARGLREAYFTPPVAEGVYPELFGPVDYFKNSIYVFLAACIILGVVLVIRGRRSGRRQ